jgi:serine/threonine protein kinase
MLWCLVWTEDDEWVRGTMGQTLAGRYQVEEVLGGGATGVVFLGRHTWTRRAVALKVLRPDLRRKEPTLAARFFREAQAAASVAHRHVVDVLDMGEDGDLAFLALELLEGEPLATRLAREPALDLATTLRIVVPILDALEAVHAQNLIHRDVTAGNVFLHRASDELRPTLLDFGAVRPLESHLQNLTLQGHLLGTPHYMAPEQIRNTGLTPAADQVGAAVLLFRMMAGRFPFQRGNLTQLLADIVTRPPPRLIDLRPALPRGVSDAVARAMAKEPADRFGSMRELMEALLSSAQREAGVTVPRPSGA